MREVKRKNPKTNRKKGVLLQPIWTGHADFIHPFDFISFFRTHADLEVDVMLEAKAKDLALIRLRHDLARYAPDVAQRFGLKVEEELADSAADEVEIDAEQMEAAAG